MATEINNQRIVLAASRAFHRYNFVVFIVIVGVVISTIAFGLLGVSQTALDSSIADGLNQPATFDAATIKRLGELKSAEEPGSSLDTSAYERVDPFTEQ